MKLTTALYSVDSMHIANDPVFGVKKSLIKKFDWSEDVALAQDYDISVIEKEAAAGGKTRGFWILQHEFILSPS